MSRARSDDGGSGTTRPLLEHLASSEAANGRRRRRRRRRVARPRLRELDERDPRHRRGHGGRLHFGRSLGRREYAV